MEEILRDLNKIEGIKGVAIVSNDGLIVNSLLPLLIDPDAVGGMCASSFRNAVTTAKVLEAGRIKNMIIETETDFIIFTPIGNGFLAIVSDKSLNLGYLRIRIDKAVKQLMEKMIGEE
jgi:predicted regulator of Ras-like GTPase activity (Roadblock/LC7/MglB family)